jgi:CHAT domain-containing protein/Tfp pilus assembly protein PilF
MEKGVRSFQRGDFEEAIANWTGASRLFQSKGNPKGQCRALIKVAQAYQAVGQYTKASQTLKAALVLARESGDLNLEANVLGSLGNLYIATGPEHESLRYLQEGIRVAAEVGDSSLSAVILNNLGNLYSTQQRYREAVDTYNKSRTLAQNTGNRALAAVALTNAATASMQAGQYREAKALLDKGLQQTQGLDDSHQKAFGLINIGLAYNDLRPNLSELDSRLFVLASETLNEAVLVSEAINDSRALSYGWGYLGKLREDGGDYEEALQLTRKAILTAQRVNAPESLYLWYWQSGRLLKKLGKVDEAIAAYRRAIPVLQSIRDEFASCYGKTRASFRESAGAIYLELVDLVLQRAASIKAGKQYEDYLVEAREAVEVLKVFELQDYFQDDCVGAGRFKTTRLDVVSPTAAVVYPILLPERTEILVSLPTGMERRSLKVGAEALTAEVREFRRKLEKRTTREYLPHAQKLYDWLIRPFEAGLAASAVDTLVFVPDGVLRTVPMAALHDGKRFLIDKYAVAITPGLYLADPLPIKTEDLNVLLVGLTESTQGFPPLPYVSSELETVHSLYPSQLLVNEEFSSSSVQKALADEEFAVMHVASHAQFNKDVDKTFLLTFDDKLTLDRLDEYVGLLRFRDAPLELLTLSACDTAAGDDRAALGLAGVAVKAGARSAVATLWYINDLATSTLVGEFYKQLQEPGVSRGVALQRAQLKMLDDRRWQHPGYWSPFILINNWL